MHSVSILNEDLRTQLATYAQLASQQFSAEEIDAISSKEDMTLPIFTMLVERAQRIKESIPDVAYVYVMRRTEDPMQLAFVIEDDMLASREELDLNGDNIIQADEEKVFPGHLYDISSVPFMQHEAFVEPIADQDITYDQWGSWISGYAPIFNSDGESIAILGLDMRAQRFNSLVHRIFSPIGVIAVLFAIFLVIGLYGFSLLRGRLRFIQASEEHRRQLVRIASHKLGGPIASIRWWLELLNEPVQDIDFDAAKRELTSAADRIAHVAKELEEAIAQDVSPDAALISQLAQETKIGIDGDVS